MLLSGCATQTLQLNAPAGVDQAQAILDRDACTKRHLTSNGNMYFDEDYYNACMIKKGYVFKLVNE